MKIKNIQLEESDAQALILALHLLPTLDMGCSDVQQSINDTICETCIRKISNGDTLFSANEIRILYCAIAAMDEVIRDKYDIPADEQKQYCQYVFNVNKLLPIFESLLPEA